MTLVADLVHWELVRKFDPAQPRDELGMWSKDKLGLAGKMDLDTGEELVGSRSFKTAGSSAVLAHTDFPGHKGMRNLYLGVVSPGDEHKWRGAQLGSTAVLDEDETPALLENLGVLAADHAAWEEELDSDIEALNGGELSEDAFFDKYESGRSLQSGVLASDISGFEIVYSIMGDTDEDGQAGIITLIGVREEEESDSWEPGRYDNNMVMPDVADVEDFIEQVGKVLAPAEGRSHSPREGAVTDVRAIVDSWFDGVGGGERHPGHADQKVHGNWAKKAIKAILDADDSDEDEKLSAWGAPMPKSAPAGRPPRSPKARPVTPEQAAKAEAKKQKQAAQLAEMIAANPNPDSAWAKQAAASGAPKVARPRRPRKGAPKPGTPEWDAHMDQVKADHEKVWPGVQEHWAKAKESSGGVMPKSSATPGPSMPQGPRPRLPRGTKVPKVGTPAWDKYIEKAKADHAFVYPNVAKWWNEPRASASMHFHRGYTDGEEARAGSPGDPIRFVASTPGVKRDGLDLRANGWRLDNYRRSPVFQWCHDKSRPPLGRVDATAGDQLTALVTFDQEDEFARRVESKYRRGFLHAVSVGWDFVDGQGTRLNTGRLSHDEIRNRAFYDLTELSGVPVPADPDALIARERAALRELSPSLVGLFDEQEYGDALAEEVRAALDDELERLGIPIELLQWLSEPANRVGFFMPEDSGPADTGIDQQAARAVLDAFNLQGAA